MKRHGFCKVDKKFLDELKEILRHKDMPDDNSGSSLAADLSLIIMDFEHKLKKETSRKNKPNFVASEYLVDAVIRDRVKRRGCSYWGGAEERERVKIRRDLVAAFSVFVSEDS